MLAAGCNLGQNLPGRKKLMMELIWRTPEKKEICSSFTINKKTRKNKHEAQTSGPRINSIYPTEKKCIISSEIDQNILKK
jgi:hypothetical protein